VEKKIRIYELTKELGKSFADVKEILNELNIPVKSSFSTIDEETANIVKEIIEEIEKSNKKEETKSKEKVTAKVEPKKEKRKESDKVEFTISKLSKLCQVPEREIELKLLKYGVVVDSYDRVIPDFAAKNIIELYDVELNVPIEAHIEAKTYVQRAPVITVMGHVDHGKTTLLDTIRKTRIAEKELGGITQRIGAYVVEYAGKKIIFIDTPGHEAFTAMREKGAEVTDIVVLVVAADDGVKDQTIEAIDHAKAAKVPIIVAINKIDKPNANPDLVKQQISDHGLLPEEWGGDTICVNISAKNGTGIEDLLEMIELKAELMDLRTNIKAPFAGTVIESFMTKSFGAQITLIIQVGHLRIGDTIGYEDGTFKVRAMYDTLDKSLRIAEALIPVKIAGIPFVVRPGTILRDVTLLSSRAPRVSTPTKKQVVISDTKQFADEKDFFAQEESKESRFNLMIKADSEGALDAVDVAVSRINVPGVKLNILHKGVGMITGTDVLLASVSKALIVGFNVTTSDEARREAKAKDVEIRLYRLIFDLIDEVRNMVEGKLKPKEVENILGTAEVKQIFKVSKVGVIAGCIVRSGIVQRGAHARIIRDRKIITETKIDSLKRFKEDVKEVREGFECGIGLENYNDIKVGDIFEVYEKVAKK